MVASSRFEEVVPGGLSLGLRLLRIFGGLSKEGKASPRASRFLFVQGAA
jgi:hypothetical protein